MSQWPVEPYDVEVRLGSKSGRLFVTGLRVGVPDEAIRAGMAEPHEIKNLRSVQISEILGAIREKIASKDWAWSTPLPLPGFPTLADTLLAAAKPSNLTVRRGPIPDTWADARMLEFYEKELVRASTKTEAIEATATAFGVTRSQVYRRLSRARSASAERGTE
jgi:hypothetical protein